MAHDPGSTRALLHDAVDLACKLNSLLEIIVPWTGTGQSDEVKRHGVMTHSSPPWQAQAANLVMDLHAEARTLERGLKDEILGEQRSGDRGGSSKNTVLALKALLNLVEAVEDTTAISVLQELERWVSRAEIVLGRSEPARTLPRRPGDPEPRCPWCGYCTLRSRPQTGLVCCVNPDCRDDEGRRPRATMSLDDAGTPVLTWQDGYWQDSTGASSDVEVTSE